MRRHAGGASRLREARRQVGFTLVEVLVAVAAAGALGAAMAALVHEQHEFLTRGEDGLLARQNVRATAELMASELRGAAPGDLLVASEDSVVLRFDLLRAVVCAALPTGEVDLFVYDSVASANVPARFRGTALSGPYEPDYRYADGHTPAWAVSGQARSSCRANGADPEGTAHARHFRRAGGWQASFGTTPVRGSMLRWYGRLTYGMRPSGTHAGLEGIWRNGQEFVTPFEPAARFRYVLEDGSVRSDVLPHELPDVREIRIEVTAVGETPLTPRRPMTHSVPLRNR